MQIKILKTQIPINNRIIPVFDRVTICALPASSEVYMDPDAESLRNKSTSYLPRNRPLDFWNYIFYKKEIQSSSDSIHAN